MTTYVKHTLKASTRQDARHEIVNLFLQEQPGTGRKDLCERYNYDVESFRAYKIILKRPASRNNGFDFTIHIDGLKFKKKKTYSHPSHDDIINILCAVKKNNQVAYQSVATEIQKIYDFKPYNLSNVANIQFSDFENTTHPIEIILLAIKWLFIEQDVTYWNYSGRAMFLGAFRAEKLI